MDAELRELCERLRGLLAKQLARVPVGDKDDEYSQGYDDAIRHVCKKVGDLLPRLLDTIAAQAAELDGVRAMLELQQPGATTNSSSFIPIADSGAGGGA